MKQTRVWSLQTTLVSPEPLVSAMVGGGKIYFLVDMGAMHSVVTKPLALKSNQVMPVVGASG